MAEEIEYADSKILIELHEINAKLMCQFDDDTPDCLVDFTGATEQEAFTLRLPLPTEGSESSITWTSLTSNKKFKLWIEKIKQNENNI